MDALPLNFTLNPRLDQKKNLVLGIRSSFIGIYFVPAPLVIIDPSFSTYRNSNKFLATAPPTAY
jgi:hypothetical protein